MRTQSLLAAWNDTRTRGPFLERSPGASSQGGIRPVRFPALSKVAQKRHLLRGFPSPGRRARRRPASGDGVQGGGLGENRRCLARGYGTKTRLALSRTVSLRSNPGRAGPVPRPNDSHGRLTFVLCLRDFTPGRR